MSDEMVLTSLDPLERLPNRLRESPYTVGVSTPMTELAQAYWEATLNVADQFFVPTATWGLPEWERLVGITPAAGATLESRRSAVIAKLCSTGTTNAEMIRALAEALTGYGAKVTENFGSYSFSLRFYGEVGGFINIDADLLLETVEVIKPAHLQFVVEPISWADIEEAQLTWQQLEDQFDSWEALENAFYCHGEDEDGTSG